MNNPLLSEIKNWLDDPRRARCDKQAEGYMALLVYLVEKGESREAHYREQWEASIKANEAVLERIKDDTT